MPNTARQTQSTSRYQIWIDGLSLLLIGGAALRLLSGMTAVIDLGLADEARYLDQGVKLLAEGFPSPQWAPLYSAWYFALASLLGRQDNAQVYDLSFILLSVSLPLVLYVYLRRIKTHPLVALPAAILYLASFANLKVWPYPTKFAALILATVLLATTFLPRRVHYAALMLGLLLLCFVRPEYTLALGLATALASVIVLYRTRQVGWPYLKPIWPQILTLVGIAIVLSAVMGNPLAGGRSLLAVKQHFALNYTSWGISDADPWVSYEEITTQVFGQIQSVPDLVRNNPAAFGRHVLSNFTLYPQHLLAAMFRVYLPLRLAPPRVDAIAMLSIAALVMGIVILCLGLNMRYARQTGVSTRPAALALPALRGQPNTYQVKLLALLFVLVSAPALVASLLIYPRYHYLQIQALLLLALAAVFISNTLALYFRPRPASSLAAVGVGALGVALILLLPNLAHGWLWSNLPPAQSKPHVRSTVQAIRALDITEPVVFLAYGTAMRSFNVFLGDSFTKVPSTGKTEAFAQFLADNRINMVIWPDKLLEEPRFVADTSYQRFVQEPTTWGFVEVRVPGVADDRVERRVFVQEGLVGQQPAALPSAPAETPDRKTPRASTSTARKDQLARAAQLVQEDQLEEALQVYQAIVQTYPTDRAGRVGMVDVLAKMGRQADAMAEIDRIIADWPDFPWAYTRRGALLEQVGDASGALRAYQTAVQLAPDNANSHFVLAYAFRRAGERAKAIAEFEAGLKLDPNRQAARRALEQLLTNAPETSSEP